MVEAKVHLLSKSIIRPSLPNGAGAGAGRRIDLTPWDLKLLTVEYIQKGILLPKPHQDSVDVLSRLTSSLSLTLDHFFPFAGRLATVKRDTSPPSISIHIHCDDQGVELVHAAAADVTVSDILTPVYIPRVVASFFPLNGAIGLDGHSLPLFAVQVTELADGIFIGCSLNHAVCDGVPFWHFINSWSEISRTNCRRIANTPVLDRWFPESCPPPILLPYSDHGEIIPPSTTRPPRLLHECFFHFSAGSVAELKARANLEMHTITDDRISSLQALLAHTWRSVTHARKLDLSEETTYGLAIGYRSRLQPPLPPAYLGNAVMVGAQDEVKATAGEVLEQGLGRVAWKLNQVVASRTDGAIRDCLKSWTEDPTFTNIGGFKRAALLTGSSTRYDVFGNDFGWGRPVAVRSGWANKFDGKVTVYPGPEKGSIGLEVCLLPEALSLLVKDSEFFCGQMEAQNHNMILM